MNGLWIKKKTSFHGSKPGMIPNFLVLFIVAAAAVAALVDKVDISDCNLQTLVAGSVLILAFLVYSPGMKEYFDPSVDGPAWKNETDGSEIRIGVNPKLWGPTFWTVLHWVTIGYPDSPSEKVQEAALSFLSSLPYLLPCKICREHLTGHLSKPEYTPRKELVSSRQAFGTYLVNLHDTVTRMVYESEGLDTSQLRTHVFPDDVFVLMRRVRMEPMDPSLDKLQKPQSRLFGLQRHQAIYLGIGAGLLWAFARRKISS